MQWIKTREREIPSSSVMPSLVLRQPKTRSHQSPPCALQRVKVDMAEGEVERPIFMKTKYDIIW